MVGGKSLTKLQNINELIYRFEFFDRPGALYKFLKDVNNCGWNISLFHYRNHGSDLGRVLVGFQVNQMEQNNFKINFLKKLSYKYYDENNNCLNKLFLL